MLKILPLFFIVAFIHLAHAAVPQVLLSKNPALFGEKVDISFQNLVPESTVTFKVRRVLYGRVFESSNDYIVDSKGAVEVNTAAPISGSYSGPDIWGPFWSMRAIGMPTENENLKPDEFYLSLESKGIEIAHVKLRRMAYIQGVSKQTVNVNGLVGEFYFPSGKRSNPALLILGGSEGGLATSDLAAYMASQGYAALSLAYFRAEGLPQSLRRIPLEYLETGVKWLEEQKTVNPKKLELSAFPEGRSSH